MDNIMLPAYFSPDKDKRKDMISGYAKQLGIKERLNHRPQELSAGEQQRVAVLRSIVNEPSVLIADEPTADLDNPTSEKILEILKDLNRAKKCTVILATNDANIAARFPLKFNLP
jgi:ABC-type lipoprotein export system ATPase subunit